MTKIDKVIKALRSSTLTRKQIASRFKVPNVRAILFDIKRKGYHVSFLLKGKTEYIRIANAA